MLYQEIDGVKFKMGRQFDFDFLKKYGKVFKVYDGQDSGNICFGIENKGRKIFVKFAGAQTAEYKGDVFEAIQRLKATVPICQSIKQKSLIKYIASEEIGQGFAMIFEWADGECMGRMWGSSRFMSPEEYKYGEKIDEISNVFMIGKMGFSILTDSDLSFEHYPLSLESFHVLEKAANPVPDYKPEGIDIFKLLYPFFDVFQNLMGFSCKHDTARHQILKSGLQS